MGPDHAQSMAVIEPGGSPNQMPICERCSTENPAGFRFCGECGIALPDPEPTHDARKVVTALFCDVADSTSLAEQLDPEAVHGILRRYFEELTATILRHGGTVQKFAGDAVLAIFGIPRVHEDDALRAVRAAAEIRERLPLIATAVGVVLQFRTGINTGLVHTDPRRSLAIGDPINVAARLEQAADPGEILLGSETLRMVRDAVEVDVLEPLELKGKQSPVAAFRLLSVDPAAPGVIRHLEDPLVGRERELQLLREFWEDTVAQRNCRLFTILGGAGVGKSRLVEELLSELKDTATVLRGRCLHYGEGITFWPILEALAQAGEDAQGTIEHLSRGGAATPEELFWEVRVLLERLAQRTPLILHIDDLQWAESMLIDLLGHIVDLSRGAPIGVLCTARPELLEDHHGWTARETDATLLRLEPLDREDCEVMLKQIGDELSAEARARVIRTSEGNPLFLQEMIALAREQGGDEVPATIQALLAARLDRLGALEREPLEQGAVEGQVFHGAAVHALAPRRSAKEIDEGLEGLVRKDLIRRQPSTLGHHHAFRFRHLLIRDTAYGALPMATRADLHARFADWLEAVGTELIELDEIVGWHLEQAVLYKRELRHKIEPELARRAAQHLYEAGRRAGDRSDMPAARSLLERALLVTPAGDPLREVVGVALAERLIEAGDLGRADELLSLAEHGGDEFGPAALNRLEWLIYSRPDEAGQTLEATLPRMLEEFARTDDQRGLAKAHWLAFWVHWAENRATRSGEQARLAAQHAREAGDYGLWSRALGWYVATLIFGPADAVTIASELDAISGEEPGPYLAACIELGRAEVRRLEGRFDLAHRHAETALATFHALGMRAMAATCDQTSGTIELSRDGAEAAIPYLERSEATFAELGERVVRSTTQAWLGHALQMRGEPAAAQAAVELAEALGAPQDMANFAITHAVRARLALASGERDAAERWARSAVEHASQTDFVHAQAAARLGLARVLADVGAAERAQAEASAALGLFQVKGDVPGEQASRALLQALDAGRTR